MTPPEVVDSPHVRRRDATHGLARHCLPDTDRSPERPRVGASRLIMTVSTCLQRLAEGVVEWSCRNPERETSTAWSDAEEKGSSCPIPANTIEAARFRPRRTKVRAGRVPAQAASPGLGLNGTQTMAALRPTHQDGHVCWASAAIEEGLCGWRTYCRWHSCRHCPTRT